MNWRVPKPEILRHINSLANAGCPNDECHAVIFTTERVADTLRDGAGLQDSFIGKWESCNVVLRIMYLVFDI